MRLLLIGGLFFTGIGVAQAEEREISVVLSPFYAQPFITTKEGERLPGGGGGLHLAYGLTDAVSLQMIGGASAHPPVGESPLRIPFYAMAGASYALDIVRIVPYFEAHVGAVGLVEESERRAFFGLSFGVGADYLLTRTWAVGAGLRLFTSLSDPNALPLYLTVGPRLVARYGF